MQVVNLKDVPLVERAHAREGKFEFYSLLNGKDDTPGNFFLQLAKTYSDFASPRHRHNFDQFRFQLEGTVDFGKDGSMPPGTLGYFPEGMHYGPQSIKEQSLTLVLQFGGASGSGYMSEERLQQGIAELKTRGVFENGVYTTYLEDGTKKNKDGYQAVWEHISQRPLDYPPARYNRPLFMNTEAFQWTATAEEGVRRKHLATFTERLTTAALVALDPGATLRAAPNTILFVISGAGVAEGRGWERYSVLYDGQREATATATQQTEILEIGLPRL